jgi:peptide/nickel transport system substrate-binding protein
VNRIDRAVVGGLILVVVIAGVLIAGPALAPAPAPSGAAPVPSSAAVTPYREGVLGRPTGINPLSARTQADRDLVALVFEGLASRDAAGRPVPALATSWTSSKAGDEWTFTLDPAARWQDGEPVTAADVVFTIETIQDPAYHGPGAGSWTGIKVSAPDPQTIRFELTTPIAGFLDLVTQPIAPEHLLGDTPPGAMADAAFGESPIGSGRYAVTELDRDHAVLERADTVAAPADSARPSASGAAPDPLATPRPTTRPADGPRGLERLEFRFFDDADSLVAAFRGGELDVVSGLDPGAAMALAGGSGAGGGRAAAAVRNPSTTLATVALNLRPTRPAFADARTRHALLAAIDRARIVSVAFGGGAVQADGLIPPSSWAFSAEKTPAVARDVAAARKLLGEAGWVKARDGWHAGKAPAPQTIGILVPDRAANPILYAIGSQIAADWTALGFTVELREDDPAVIATEDLRTGDFDAVVLDIAIGHDPDLYPLLASSQTRTGAANVVGLQDPLLDGLLEEARRPAPEDVRLAAFAELQDRLTSNAYLLPIAWPDDVVVVANRVSGVVERTVADDSERFFDVLDWRLADDR